MKTTVALILLVLTPAVLAAQDLSRFEEVTTANFFGLGARQMSLGGAGIASSLDGAALYYNPAALASIHKIELQLGLTHQKFSNETSQPAGRYDGFTSVLNAAKTSQTKTRFGSINLTVPVPTYRGSLALAFGVNRIQSFDRAALFNVIDRNAEGLLVEDYAKEFEAGGIYIYSAGAGVDVSPNLSLGLALHVYSGKDDFTYEYAYRDETNGFGESIDRRVTEDYVGASLKGGLLARPNENLTIGLTVESPMDYQVEYVYQEDYVSSDDPDQVMDAYVVEYDLTRPFVFGGGAAFRIGTFTVTGDAEYADWSQTAYGDNPDMEIDNDTLSLLYRDVLNLRGGIEYEFPSVGLALRAGAFSNPLPYRSEAIVDGRNKVYIDSDRKGFSLGFGWLIVDVLLLETAYVRGGYTRGFSPANAENVNVGTDLADAEDTFSRVYFTLSYRY